MGSACRCITWGQLRRGKFHSDVAFFQSIFVTLAITDSGATPGSSSCPRSLPGTCPCPSPRAGPDTKHHVFGYVARWRNNCVVYSDWESQRVL